MHTGRVSPVEDRGTISNIVKASARKGGLEAKISKSARIQAAYLAGFTTCQVATMLGTSARYARLCRQRAKRADFAAGLYRVFLDLRMRTLAHEAMLTKQADEIASLRKMLDNRGIAAGA